MNKLFIFLVLCFASSSLFAQDRTNLCLEFEELPLDSMYGAPTGYTSGDLFFEEEGISVTLSDFIYPDGTTEFFATTVLEDPFNFQTNNTLFSRGLFVSNVNLNFDLTGFSEDITRVSLNFFDGGGEENLSVNGEEIQIIDRISQLNGREIAPGVEAIFRVDSSFFPMEYGTLVLEGSIKNFSIGGQELFIDNLCVRTSNAVECSISNLNVRAGECFDNGQYNASVNFNHEGAENDLFDYFLNGELIGTKALADLPVLLDLPYLYNTGAVTLSVCINDQPDCCQRFQFNQPDCDFVGDCVIDFFGLYSTDCDEQGNFLVNVFVTAQDGSERGYFIEDIFGERFGPFSYFDSTVVIGPYSDLLDVLQQFTVIDAVDENCKATKELIDPCGNACRIESLVVEAHECDDNGQFLVDVEVKARNGSAEGFYIKDIFGEKLGPFSYEETFVTIGPYTDLDDVPHVFTIVDATNENCQARAELFGICPACRFEEVFFEPHPCDENGQFLLDIFILAAQGGNPDGFFVNYMGEEFGPFSYQDSLLTIGPLSAGFDAPPEIVLYDAEDPNCAYTDIISPPCGLDCNFRIAAELTECNANGVFFAEVIVVGGLSEYTIEAGGRIWGPFAYGDRNVRIGPFQNNGSPDFALIIHDQVLPYCSDTLALENPCFIDGCGFTDISTATTACRADGSFGLRIRYNLPTDGLDSILLQYQDRVLGYYIANEVIEIENFVFRQDNFVRLCILNGNEECCQEVRFDVPEGCEGGGGTCALEDVRIRPKECDEAGKFYVELSVWSENAGDNGYFVDVFGEIFGPFSYLDSVAVIGPFDGTIDEIYEIIISDVERPECFYVDIFRAPCRNDACTLEDVFIAPTACDANNQFQLEVEVWNGNINSEGYIIKVNGSNYGPFSYFDSLVILGPFDGNSNAAFEVTVFDLNDRTCFVEDQFFSPCSETCRLTDLSVETGECNEDGSFDLFIDVDAQSITNDSIDLFYNGRLLRTFVAFDLPITYDDFNINEERDSIHIIQLCVKGNPDCCVSQEIFPPCSSSNCHITNVIAEPLVCENNEFKVDLFVESTQPNLTGYFIQVNDGPFFGPFSYEQEFVTIGPFVGDGSTIYRVNVVDGEDRACRNSTRFQAVSCASQCNINDLIIEVGEICSEDSTFPVSIDLDIQNPIGIGYAVYLENRLLGTYPYGTDPLFFPRFDLGGRASATIAVVAGEDRNCAIRKILEAPECSIDTSDLWPGDTNNDGFVHHFDLLNIGLAYGTEGPARLDSSLFFAAQNAPRWQQAFDDGINYKHADANGDGRIDELDVEIIELNYGQNREDTDITSPEVDIEATEGDPSIYVDLPETGDFPNGTAFSIPVILGSEDRTVESVYGIAFSVEYNPAVIDPNTLQFTIPDTWLGDTENDLLMIQRSYPERGLLEVAISRTDGESVTGYGVIALMSGIIVDLVGLRTVAVKVSKVKAISNDKSIIPIFPEERGTKITTSTNNLVESGLSFYPNPAHDLLHIRNTNNRIIQQIEIVNAQGQVVQRYLQPDHQITLSLIPNGLYILRIQTKDGLFYQQILKQ